MNRPHRLLLAASLMLNVVLLLVVASPLKFVGAQQQILYFPETGHTIKDVFLDYWTDHGALAQQGYPLTEEFQEKSTLDGKTYTVQYFERAVFEKHPENQPPYDVLLSQLGRSALDARYPNNSNPAAARVTPPPAPPAPPTPTITPTPKPTNTLLPSPTPQPPILSVPFCQSADKLKNEDVFVCWSSESGDYIGQGLNNIWTSKDTVITLSLTGRDQKQALEVRMQDTNYWTITFAPPDGKPLYPGRYPNVARYPFYNPLFGGFDASGGGRGCNQLAADYEILDIATDPVTGEVLRFAANFKQNCEVKFPPLHGEVRYHTSVKP